MVKVEDSRLMVNKSSATKRTHIKHDPHPLTRKLERAPGPPRVLGISTTNMDVDNPRYSTSDALLEVALEHARTTLGAETRMIRLAELAFRACEGYYSKSAHACTWPCSITQMDPEDQVDRVYESVVHWGDVLLLAMPIRWGNASSLYYKMVERFNCIQNQVTIANRVLIRNKVAAFIITGGQDNVQQVAGHLLGFFGEIGFRFPQFPYIAHSRGVERGRHGEQHQVRAVQRRTARGRTGTDGARGGRIVAVARSFPGPALHVARRSQGASSRTHRAGQWHPPSSGTARRSRILEPSPYGMRANDPRACTMTEPHGVSDTM
ncbi:MAG: NAD(P)H-dependent oxidoreductase [Gemmatimonadaceae bacterium]